MWRGKTDNLLTVETYFFTYFKTGRLIMQYLKATIIVLSIAFVAGCSDSLNKSPSNNSDPNQSTRSDSESNTPSLGKGDKVNESPDLTVPDLGGELPEPAFEYIEITGVNKVSNTQNGIAVNIKEGVLKIIQSSGTQSFDLQRKHEAKLIKEVFTTKFRGQFYDGFECAKRSIDSQVFYKLVTKPMGHVYRETGEPLRYTSRNKNVTKCLIGQPQSEDGEFLQNISRLLVKVAEIYNDSA
jgi:hypothetical protein